MQEEILLKRYRTGSTITFFNTMITEDNFSTTTTPAALYFNSMGEAFRMIVASEIPMNTALNTSGQLEIWSVSGIDNIQRLQDVPTGGRVITGRTFSQITEKRFIKHEGIKRRFNERMEDLFSGQSESYTFVSDAVLDDFDVTFKLERTHDVLNTLSTYNKTYNEFPDRDSKTGVVFGKLEAIQKIKDEEGNFIRIPLRGVPIGVFLPGKKFQNVSDVDENGNRIRLNFKDLQSNLPSEQFYSNRESYDFDTGAYLENKNDYIFDPAERIISMPEEFKLTVLTNDHGEFVIHDVPTGPQILMFEVDLLQQGLTTDEVALNFFPYRGENVSNVDEVPHFFFRNIPIDVLPTWGTALQTGYTEVNVSANLDLRKWATYFFPPVCAKLSNTKSVFYDGDTNSAILTTRGDSGRMMLDRSNYNTGGVSSIGRDVYFKIGDPYLSRLSPAPVTIEIRDMTKFNANPASFVYSEDKSAKGIQVVKINNILERKSGQINSLSWQNEFSQISDRVEIREFGYTAIKLPANLYDPNAYRTDEYGKPKNGIHQKGVWLNAYQFKMYHVDKDLGYRTTGHYKVDWRKNKSRDPFHLNTNFEGRTSPAYDGKTSDLSATDINKGARIGLFPFQKPWSLTYPTKYSIPEVPKEPCPAQTISKDGVQYRVMETPNYKDGDWIGEKKHKPSRGIVQTAGFAHAKYDDLPHVNIPGGTLAWYSTSFSYSVSNSSLYAYEDGSWREFGRYASGYSHRSTGFSVLNSDNSAWITSNVNYPSYVKNGEKWQRVEAGHGYYLHAYGMPKINRTGTTSFDFAGTYSTSLAANGRSYAGPGFKSTPGDGLGGEDTNFYYGNWNTNYSVAFDDGKTFGLRLDYVNYDYAEQNIANQRAFSIYRIVNPGTLADSTEVFSLIETSTPIVNRMSVYLGRTRIQNERTANERSKYRQHSTDANSWSYWASSTNGDTSKAKMYIQNKGIRSAFVTVGSNAPEELAVGEGKEFVGSWDNVTLKVESNDNVTLNSDGNFEYLGYKYYVAFRNLWMGDHHRGDNDILADGFDGNGNSSAYAANISKVGSTYTNRTIYLVSRMNGIRVRKKCSKTTWWRERDVWMNGMLFVAAPTTQPSTIAFWDTTVSTHFNDGCDGNESEENCWCSAYDGYYQFD